MGAFINDQEIIENNIQDKFKVYQTEFSRFYDKPPVFVTYYNYDKNSLNDLGLENVEANFGRDTPTKYNKISDVPIFSFSQLSMEGSFEETGFNTNSDGEGVIVMDTITPYVGDFFFIKHVGKNYLFRVNKADKQAFHETPTYRINFHFEREIKDEKELEKLTAEKYHLIFDNIGSESRTVVQDDIYLLTNYANKIIKKLYNFMRTYYYDKILNLISYKFNYNTYYDIFLTKFIKEHELFLFKRQIMENIYLDDARIHDPYIIEHYKHTIFYAIDHQTTKYLDRIFMDSMDFAANNFESSSFWGIENITYLVYSPIPSKKVGFDWIYEDFLKKIKSKESCYFRKRSKVMEDIILHHLHKNLELDNDILTVLDETDLIPSAFNFIVIPIIMYILKSQIKLLINRTIK